MVAISMESSPWEADNREACQVPCCLWNSKIHYYNPKSPAGSTHRHDAGNTSEMLVNLYRLHKATSKKIHLKLAWGVADV
jgi:hypothetical protein